MSPTSTEGGRRSGEVFRQLAEWHRKTGLGAVFDSSTGFNLADGSCLSPDAAWISRPVWDGLTQQEREGFAPVCPHAVPEVRSPPDSMRELRAKASAYAADGARMVVLIDVDDELVEVQRPGRTAGVWRGSDAVSLDPELPGSSLDLDAVRTA